MCRGARRMSSHKNIAMPHAEHTLPESLHATEWFAMSATFGRELKAKAYLEENSVRCFIPMRYEIVDNRKEGKTRRLVPAINNLIFVHTTRERIQHLKTFAPYLQYLTHPVEGRNLPIIVPEHQMQQFIKVCETYHEKLVYLAPHEIHLSEGTPVRIVGSAFDGVEGTFVKIRNRRKKRVVVLVRDVAAVVLAEFTDGYLQVLE